MPLRCAGCNKRSTGRQGSVSAVWKVLLFTSAIQTNRALIFFLTSCMSRLVALIQRFSSPFSVRMPFASICRTLAPSLDSRYQVNPLPHIGAVVNTNIQPLFPQILLINGSRPLLPPVFQRFRLMPVCCMDSVKHIIAVFIPDSVSIFIKKIFPTLFLSPCAIRVQKGRMVVIT